MSWLIYTLLGVLIIVLLAYIVLSVVRKSEPIKEGMFDYFTIEQYLQTIPTTQGRYVHIRPSGTQRLTISQIQVLDMNGDNIAKGKLAVDSSTRSPGAPVSSTVDGNPDPRAGFANVWTTAGAGQAEWWELDLGSTQQINQVIYSGQSGEDKYDGVVNSNPAVPLPQQRSAGMTCDILDTDRKVVASQVFPSTSITQTLTFLNSINLTPTPTGEAVGTLNPLIMPLNSAQPEVYLVNGDYKTAQIDITCGLLGAVVATTGQMNSAYINGASWSTIGWTAVAGNKKYVLSNPVAKTGITTVEPTVVGGWAAVNCFGIKPANGVSANVSPFNSNSWSQYTNNTAYNTNYGSTSVNVPDINKLNDYISKTLVPEIVSSINNSINTQAEGRNDLTFKRTFKTGKKYSISELDSEIKDIYNPYSCLSVAPPCKMIAPFPSLATTYGSLADKTLFGALTTAPLNLIYDYQPKVTSPITQINSKITILGTASAQALSDMNASIDLCSKLFLGSDPDVDLYLNISTSDLKPYIRGFAGFGQFCRPEIVQTVERGDYTFKVVAANQTTNASVCKTPFTTDMMGLLPSAARDYVQIWIYNRIKRVIQYKKTSSTLTQADLNNLKLTSLTPSADINKINSSITKMYPTVGGNTLALDVTNKYILDKIAQAFYEAMGGNYIMSQIYDVFTIGGSIIDIRFDMTKHADISEIQGKLAALRTTYYGILNSNVSQDILDSAKVEFETAVEDLQGTQTTNTLPPITGVVGRFFYTYSTSTQDFFITGFTLDSRAVTSFVPELNCGLLVSKGSDPGAINYEPTVVYTKNIPEALACTDSLGMRKVMDDYINLTQLDLKKPLLGTLQRDGKTLVGPHGTPSVDTTLGTVRINKILGIVQLNPTQCAFKWTETLWNDLSNTPVSPAVTNITRNALFSYAVDTLDWYSNTITIDASGVILYPNDTIPACKFDTESWQNITSPRLDTASIADVQKDFIANGWNNGMGLVCPKQLPNYVFNAQDYCAANPSLKSICYPDYSVQVDSAAAKLHYSKTGIFAGLPIRAAQTITATAPVITFQQPLPANDVLDTLDGTCPPTTCEDLNVLYSLVDQYNNEASMPGSILRVTRAHTASSSQCDVEVDINYNVKAKNGDDKLVIKGSFTYDDDGDEVKCTNCPPKDLSRVYSGVTLALATSRNVADCTFSLDDTEGQGSGMTIQSNTPQLYKPMEYATFLTDVNAPSFNGSFDAITGAISDAALSATSILTSYRDNTAAAVGSIATLGSGCASKCSDTAVMNNMLAFYTLRMKGVKQVNTVLRMGTLNSTTCDMTFQEDTLAAKPGGGFTVSSSQTAGMRFTLAPDTAACTFKTTGMTPILPDAPPSTALDMSKPPSAAACAEVYGINANTLTQQTAAAKCGSYNAVLATHKQLNDAAVIGGATWASKGFVVDVSGVYAPNGSQLSSSFTQIVGGAACYGVKPPSGKYADVLPFAGNQWNQPGACSTPINYVNPSKEAFMNYGTPVQVSESTFPLNKQSFGLDMARNRGGPELDTLYEEPLRAADRPSETYGPQGIEEQPLLSPGKGQSYKYIRFRPVKTRDPAHPTVEVGKFRFLLGPSEVDLRFAKVTNPMGTWVGDTQDVVGAGFRRGFSDEHKKAIVFAFPYAMLMNGFTWTTANPDKGVGGDPVQWKLEGSQNGTYWTTLRDQTKHNYPVPVERYQELPLFRF